jgi:hypothetical protein
VQDQSTTVILPGNGVEKTSKVAPATKQTVRSAAKAAAK